MQVTSVLFLLAAAMPAEEAGSPSRAIAIAHANALEARPRDVPYYRYFWISTKEKDRDDFLIAFKLHLNLLSTQGKIATPILIAPDVIRIDMRDYGWDKKLEVWERFADLDVYLHTKSKALADLKIKHFWPGGQDGKTFFKQGRYNLNVKAGQVFQIPAPTLPVNRMYDLRQLTYSEAPMLMAEWFFVQTARQISIRNKDEKVGYYEWLNLKKRDDFFKLTGTNEKTAETIFREWRAVVARSGISQQNRQVVALGATSGRVWGTLDTFTEQGKGIAKRNLRKGEFAHNAEEWYGYLPNGLFVTFLSDNKGVAQASAPDQIGPDDSPLRTGRDARIHANLSCIRCHGIDKDFLKPIDDWARKTFRSGGVLRFQDVDKKVVLELESQYLRDLNRLLFRDRAEYMDAIREVTASQKHPNGLTAPQITKMYGEVWNRYVEQGVTIEDACREMGTTTERFKAGLAKYALPIERGGQGGGDLVLLSFLDGQKLSRLEWEDSYQLACAIAFGLQLPSLIEKRKVDK